MNTGFYKDNNFEKAYLLCGQVFEHSELIQMLRSGNIPEKQIAVLKFDWVKNKEDADALMGNLTGCDGKIREAAAFKIKSILSEDENSVQFFANPDFAPIFADAVIDINANICRLIADTVSFLKFNQEFTKIYTAKILRFAQDALDELDRFVFRDKKYVINKQLFKLYWALETLKDFCDTADLDTVQKILIRSCAQKEYTIREKAAQIAKKYGYNEIIKLLENDENYYVRAVFKSLENVPANLNDRQAGSM